MTSSRGPQRRLRLAVLASLAVAGCAAPPADDGGAGAPAQAWRAQYAALAASGTVYALDAQRSHVHIYAFRGGRAARLGHNHVLTVPAFTGYAFLPSGGAAGARFDIEFRLDALELDRSDIRAALGPAYAAAIDPDDIARTRSHMLGEANLQAQRFAAVRLHALRIAGEPPHLAAQVDVELHGRHRPVWVALTVDARPDALTATGSFVLRQSDFGVTPYSVLGGLLAVEDELVVEFQVAGATAASAGAGHPPAP